MARKTQHVVPNSDGGWSVKKGGAARASQKFENQRDAISYGKKVSKNQNAELFIHRKDGTIRERNSYGNDPCPPSDKR